MNFPNISFFFKIDSFYYKYKLIFLYNYYFKLHNVLFTNLYIRIYRYKLMRLDKKNKRLSLQNKYRKINRDLFLDKTKNKKKSFFRRKMNTVSSVEKKNIRTYMTSNNFFIFHSDNRTPKRDWSFSRNKFRKKKNYVFVNKFKDCGNQYNFDPFHPSTTYKLNEFNFYRTKKLKRKNINKKIVNLSVFDPRLSNINFKYFNNYVFSLLLDIYKNQKTKKNNFLFVLKNNVFFFYNFLLFLKKRINYTKLMLSDIKKSLRVYIYKLNLIYKFFNIDKESILLYLSYFKNKNIAFFYFYNKLINSYLLKKKKYDSLFSIYSKYLNSYNSLFLSFKKKHVSLKQLQQKKIKIISHFKNVNRYERIHSNITGAFANSMRFFNFNNITKWEKKNLRNNIYIHLNKYITLYRSVFKYQYLNTHFINRAIIYIKATTTNVFLYFIYNNKLLFKKSCGELSDVKKKERRFWRNVYPLVETLLPFLVQMKSKYKFPFVSLYLNGSDSLCTPLISRMRKHNKKFRRIVYFLFNELSFFNDKTIELKDKYKRSYIFFPIYRLKLYSIFDGFNRLSKIFFAINKVKDITSWPYNGCKRKKKKNVR